MKQFSLFGAGVGVLGGGAYVANLQLAKNDNKSVDTGAVELTNTAEVNENDTSMLQNDSTADSKNDYNNSTENILTELNK